MTGNGISADLHTHTTASDGTVNIEERVEQALKRDLDAIAITDHDTISPDLSARHRTVDGLELITGVEVRADVFDTKVEILGYYVDPTNQGLLELLERARTFRRERNDKMLARLSSTLGYEITREEVPTDKGNIGRPHLAQFLVDNGVVDSIQEAFDKYLAEDGDCFVPMERLSYEEVIRAIHDAGGVTSLAHPGRTNVSEAALKKIVEHLAENGLDGIEVDYPYSKSDDRYANISVDDAAALANEHDLLRTGGRTVTDHTPASSDLVRLVSLE